MLGNLATTPQTLTNWHLLDKNGVSCRSTRRCDRTRWLAGRGPVSSGRKDSSTLIPRQREHGIAIMDREPIRRVALQEASIPRSKTRAFLVVRFTALSCCRSAVFSRTNLHERGAPGSSRALSGSAAQALICIVAGTRARRRRMSADRVLAKVTADDFTEALSSRSPSPRPPSLINNERIVQVFDWITACRRDGVGATVRSLALRTS